MKISFFFLLIALLNLSAFYYSNDLKIKNSEELFLSSNGIRKLNQFQELFSKNEILIINKIDNNLDFKKYCRHCVKIPKQFTKSILRNPHSAPPSIISSDDNNSLRHFVGKILEINPTTVMAGPAYINHLLDKKSKMIGDIIFPLFFLLIVIIVYLLFKSLQACLFISIPTISVALFSQAAIKLVFRHSNIIISISPLLVSILIFAIFIHIVFQLRYTNNLQQALNKKSKPISYMIISTAMGFYSLYFSQLEIIKNFGLMTGTLLILSYILSNIYIRHYPQKFSIKKRSYLPRGLLKLEINKIVFYLTWIVLLFSTPFIYQNLKFDKDASNYFHKNLQVKKNLSFINNLLGGSPILDIVIPNFNEDKSFYIKMDMLEANIKEKTNQRILSANTMIKIANDKYSGTKNLPASLSAFFPLYYKAPEVLREFYPLGENYRISVLGTHISGEQYDHMVKTIEVILKKNNITYELNGQYYWLMKAQSSLINTLMSSFIISVILITIFVQLIFRKIKISTSFVFVNTFPIFIVLLLYALLDIKINIASVMAFSISIGLMVDSTFHLYYEHKKNQSIKDIHGRTILPIFWSNFILANIFILFIFIDFNPIKQFGLTMAILIYLGLFFDLLVLPKY